MSHSKATPSRPMWPGCNRFERTANEGVIMKLAIIGTGRVRRTLAEGLVSAGHQIELCCKQVDGMLNSALFREEQRSFQHEQCESIQSGVILRRRSFCSA